MDRILTLVVRWLIWDRDRFLPDPEGKARVLKRIRECVDHRNGAASHQTHKI